jgi:hypothetical protein
MTVGSGQRLELLYPLLKELARNLYVPQKESYGDSGLMKGLTGTLVPQAPSRECRHLPRQETIYNLRADNLEATVLSELKTNASEKVMLWQPA